MGFTMAIRAAAAAPVRLVPAEVQSTGTTHAADRRSDQPAEYDERRIACGGDEQVHARVTLPSYPMTLLEITGRCCEHEQRRPSEVLLGFMARSA
jgi:hypothetical protein